MKLHLIQDMATGQRLPHGGTMAEFSNDLPPRLFLSRAAALNALHAWLDGHWRTAKEWEAGEYGDGYYYQGLPEPSDSKANIERAAQRQAMRIEVRPVRLEVGP